MGEVVDLPVITTLETDPERILARAANAYLKSVVVIGWDEDGDYWFASSSPDGGEILWLMELTRHKLVTIGMGGEA